MSIAVRPANSNDVDSLLAIENAAFTGDRIARRGFLRMVRGQSSALLVAVNEGENIAGYCSVLFRNGTSNARLYSVAARPGVSGVGRHLLEAAEEIARVRGCNEIRLEVRSDNSRAIELYRRSGYLLFGTRPDYYADGATALRFHKSLGKAFDKPSKVNAVALERAVA